jgi:hypothetical protein
MADRQKKVTSIKVRMYRQGFGDCFLLQFFSKSERVFTMLIDCGIKLNTAREQCPIDHVIDDLRDQLTPKSKSKKGNAPELDVLVATHEHWDHVAFFHPETKTEAGSRNLFEDFVIQQTWRGWTENPNDKQAVALNTRLRRGATALQIAATQLQEIADRNPSPKATEDEAGNPAEPDPRTAFNRGVAEVATFYGLTPEQDRLMRGTTRKKSLKTEEALSNVIDLGEKHGRVHYFDPGTLVDSQLLPTGIRVYVLGPPRDDKLKKSNPSAGSRQETYLSLDQTGFSGFIDGLLQMGEGDSPGDAADSQGRALSRNRPAAASQPFGRENGISVAEAERHPFLRQTYFTSDQSYRRIDDTWLDAAGQFALQLDGAVNNTSLVLAIEFEESEKVLLFPGDAQVGSWLSWHELEWKVKSGTETKTRTATDLLNNTVLYKVSHHGSHNATLRAKGLELMTHPDLVALIPEQEEKYAGIIHKELFDRLQQRCRGRVIVSADSKHRAEDLRKRAKPSDLSPQEWAQFQDNLETSDTYVEYTVHG